MVKIKSVYKAEDAIAEASVLVINQELPPMPEKDLYKDDAIKIF